MSNIERLHISAEGEPAFISRLRDEMHGVEKWSPETVGDRADWCAMMRLVQGCHHLDDEIRVVFHSNGSRHYRKQCISCGSPRSTYLPRAVVERQADPKDFAVFDKELQDLGESAEWRYRSWGVAEQLRDAEADRRQEYDEYLQSPEWRSLRGRVMARADGVCEGCKQAPAQEVHHLTYENFKAEFLWQLVAICSDCHRRVHKDKFST